METMTERKPQGMSFTSWIDQQIRDAERRGLFEDLPGAGKPLGMKPAGGDYGQAWVRDYAAREGVQAEEFLPAPLRLRREAERLAEVVPQMRSEEEVREAVSDLNRRIVEWRKIPDGPPIYVRLVRKDEMTALWRAAHEARTARPVPLPEPGRAPGAGRAKRRSWWRRLWKRDRAGLRQAARVGGRHGRHVGQPLVRVEQEVVDRLGVGEQVGEALGDRRIL
jgi:Domain of unknown function (DUF1992)